MISKVYSKVGLQSSMRHYFLRLNHIGLTLSFTLLRQSRETLYFLQRDLFSQNVFCPAGVEIKIKTESKMFLILDRSVEKTSK